MISTAKEPRGKISISKIQGSIIYMFQRFLELISGIKWTLISGSDVRFFKGYRNYKFKSSAKKKGLEFCFEIKKLREEETIWSDNSKMYSFLLKKFSQKWKQFSLLLKGSKCILQ